MAKIMLVEDDTNLSEIYAARMSAEGYNIVSARDGEEALAIAAKEKPDLIISDVMMPKISGFEMLDILRNTDGLKNTKVIMLTALGQAEDKQRSESLGADRYLVKSQVTLEDIVKAAQELLTDSSPLPASLATAPASANASPIPQASQPAAPAPPPTAAPPAAAQAAPAPVSVASAAPVQNSGIAGRPVQQLPVTPTPAVTPPAANPPSENTLATQATQNFVTNAAAANSPAPVSPAASQSTPATPAATDDTTVHKKVISPIGEAAVESKPDINALLAAEENKNSGSAPQPAMPDGAQAQSPATPVQPHTPGNVVAPGPTDPSSVAL
jgi:CheY-like chemotaxis protein